MKNSENNELKSLKEKSLKSLIGIGAEQNVLNIIKSKKSLRKLQNYLKSLKKEYRVKLEKDKIEFKRKEYISQKSIRKFKDYKLKVINCLVHKTNLNFEKQKKLYDIENKTKLIEYIKLNLNKEELKALKKSNIEPFSTVDTFIKISYNAMGNKR